MQVLARRDALALLKRGVWCRSRLDLMKSVKELQEQVDQANQGGAKREAQAMQVENNLVAIMTQLQRLEPKQQYLRWGRKPLSACKET